MPTSPIRKEKPRGCAVTGAVAAKPVAHTIPAASSNFTEVLMTFLSDAGSLHPAGLPVRNLKPMECGKVPTTITNHRPGSAFPRQAKGQKLGGVAAAAGRQHDILPPAQHVGHGGAGLRRRHIHRAFLLARRLVISPEHRAARTGWRGEESGLAAD